MKPILFKGMQHVLGAPTGWDAAKHGTCAGLPVVFENGVYYSHWKLSAVERFKILLGFTIQVACASASMPPIALDVARIQKLKP